MKGTFTQHGKKKKLCLLLKKGTQYSVFGHFDVLPSTDMLSMGKTIIIIEESLCANRGKPFSLIFLESLYWSGRWQGIRMHFAWICHKLRFFLQPCLPTSAEGRLHFLQSQLQPMILELYQIPSRSQYTRLIRPVQYICISNLRQSVLLSTCEFILMID